MIDFLKRIIKNFLCSYYVYNILPKFLKNKLNEYKTFIHNKELIYSNFGYWELSPNPTNDDLNEYYQKKYWSSNKQTSSLSVNQRDIQHLEFLLNEIPLRKINTFLNFGSGHGGISILLHYFGIKKIINLDPDITVDYEVIKSNSFIKCNSLFEIHDKVDLFYSSHSLEHVPDVNKFFDELKKKLNSNSYLFFEVPDCTCNPRNGGFNGDIIIPHTYYFEKSFFSNLGFELLKCESDGLSIRALLKKN